MNNKGSLIVVSGLSGAGKGTMMKRLLEKHPDEYALSISATTRDPRPGETHGKEYFFISKDEFEKMIAEGKLLEHASYVGHYYGTPREWVEEQMESGRNVILEIDIQGGLQIKEIMPDAMLVFILPPSMEELRRRLEGRGSETPEEIQKRLDRAEEEKNYIDRYNFVIINEDVEKSVDLLHNTILAKNRD